MRALAAAGRRCVAPDLYGLGDSTGAGPATFEHNLEALDGFCDALELERLALVVHDWGGVRRPRLGLRAPGPDRGAGDQRRRLLQPTASGTGWQRRSGASRARSWSRRSTASGFAALHAGRRRAAFDEQEFDAYWRPFEDGRGQRATLDFYRSMDFEKLEPYQGGLGKLAVPTLLLWGAEDDVRPAGERAPLRTRDPRLDPRHDRGRRPLRHRRAARALRERAGRLPHRPGLGDEVHRVRELERAPRVPAGEVGVLIADVDQDREPQLGLDPRSLAALVLDRVQVARRLRDQGVALVVADLAQVGSATSARPSGRPVMKNASTPRSRANR